jgi:alkanesulfonate monooxygenase SsuD/methylene tetrahydromethanopterin reductase-like flavin-dependent oxidoreductase (luciferase family)
VDDARRARGADDDAAARVTRLARDVPSSVSARERRRDRRPHLRRARRARHGLEHTAFGFPFPPLRERLERLAEQIEIVHRLWTEEHVTFSGRHFSLEDCTALPKPVQRPRPPILVGGRAKPGSVRPAVRFADEYNLIGSSLEEYAAARKTLDEACERAGRDPKTLRLSVMTGFLLGADRADLLEKARLMMDRWGADLAPEDALARYEARGTAGTPDQLIEGLGRMEEAGVERIMLQHIRHDDLETVALLGREVVPRLAA